MAAAQLVLRAPGQTKCSYHRTNTLDLLCETCDDTICVSCISSAHKGHDIVHLSEFTSQNKDKITEFIRNTEENDMIQIQTEIDSVDTHISQFYIKEEEIGKQGKKLKEDIDILIAKSLSQLQQFKEETMPSLTSYKKELENNLEGLKEKVERCKKTLQTGTDIEVFDMTSRLQPNTILPRRPNFGAAEFRPNKDAYIFLINALGEMILNSSTESPSDDTSSPSDEELLTPGRQDLPLHQILPQTIILSEWKPFSKINNICPARYDGVWTNEISCMTVTQLDSQGEECQTIDSRVPVRNISISPVTQNLWACSNKHNSVMEMVSQTLTIKFNTKEEPLCICITKDDHVIVGAKQKITEYSQRGVQLITTKKLKKPLVCSPWRISQCPVSENVVALDGDWAVDGGGDKPVIVVINNQLKLKYKYGRSQHANRQGSQPFDPYDVTYDNMGRLVIADFNNKCLHLLSGDGTYLRMLHTDTERPHAICVDRAGVLWAGFGENTTDTKTVKLLKYLAT